MLKEVSVSLVIFGALFLSLNSHASSQTITAECTTKPTALDGKRHGCSSDVTKITAPPNHVFAKATLKGGKSSANGSEHSCNISWENEVEILPGSKIMQPRTISLQAKARSPKGIGGKGRGWAKCKYTIEISKYK